VSKLRKLARGQQCQVRLPICNHDPETVVLAHIRRAGLGGMGIKPPDLCGLYACDACHSAIDGRTRYPVTDGDILDGLLRTLAIVSKSL